MESNEPIRAKIRRWYVPNATYFITAVTRNRQPAFADPAVVAVLRGTLRHVKQLYPFTMLSYVFLHDHLHLLIHVLDTTNVSKLLHSLERNMTLNYKKALGIQSHVSLWQRGFWDHVIRDERDWGRHFDYIHYNPVKHGYVSEPGAYPHSSFAEYVRRGWYGPGWGQGEAPPDPDEQGFEP